MDIAVERIIKAIEKDYNDLIKEIRKYTKRKIIVILYPDTNKNNYYLKKGIRYLNEILKNNKEIIYIDSYSILSIGSVITESSNFINSSLCILILFSNINISSIILLCFSINVFWLTSVLYVFGKVSLSILLINLSLFNVNSI